MPLFSNHLRTKPKLVLRNYVNSPPFLDLQCTLQDITQQFWFEILTKPTPRRESKRRQQQKGEPFKWKGKGRLKREGGGCRGGDLRPTGNRLIFSRLSETITGPGAVCFLLITPSHLTCPHTYSFTLHSLTCTAIRRQISVLKMQLFVQVSFKCIGIPNNEALHEFPAHF